MSSVLPRFAEGFPHLPLDAGSASRKITLPNECQKPLFSPINVRMTPIWHDIRKSQNQLLGGPQGHRVVGDSRSDRSSSVPDVANLGLARPPLIYLGSIILGMVIHFVWPARLVPPAISTPVGSIVTLAAIALFVSAVRTFRAAGTPIPGNRPTTTIVRTGPYR